ncbi:MAG: glutamate racemase [Patescibacteria group bacterium]|nr:glutamate racemase [Patescibacteria group bacterium]
MIGIFDSGLGGLTVVREVMRQLPEFPIVYFGDTARTPYGAKSRETIIKYALEDADFLVKQGAKILVVACNTVSSVAVESLKEKFNLPVFEVIGLSAKKAVEITKNGRIGVIGTRATIGSKVYEREILCHSELLFCHSERSEESHINKQIQTFSQPCPLLVSLVEENWIDKPETKTIVRKYLSSLKSKQIDTLILGCTHYPFLKDIIQKKIGRQVAIVDSAEEVSKDLKQYLVESEIKFESTPNKFFLSDLTLHAQNLAFKWLGRDIKIQKAVLQ